MNGNHVDKKNKDLIHVIRIGCLRSSRMVTSSMTSTKVLLVEDRTCLAMRKRTAAVKVVKELTSMST